MTKIERQRKAAEDHRKLARELMGEACKQCGAQHPLEYHHEDPTTKEFNVAQYFGRVRWGRIEAELSKCVVLCRPCHETTFSNGSEF